MSDTLLQEELLTAEEFWDRYSGSEQRVELVNGRLVEMPPVGPTHGGMEVDLGSELRSYVRQHDCGRIYGNSGFILRRDPLLVRGPDLAFVSNEKARTHPAPPRGYWEVIPDLIAEIVSPDDKAQDLADKVEDYMRAGVSLLWVIYPRQKQVYVYRPKQRVEILHAEASLDGQEILPGFSLPLTELWR